VTLPQGRLGYAIEHEKINELIFNGIEPSILMSQFSATYPPQNPVTFPNVVPILDQGQQGSCQGNALANIFAVCYYLHTGQLEIFSRAAGYYLAQQKDGLAGRDVGSTLSGGQWVAQTHGMCTEDDWPYPPRYDNREPANVPYNFKLATSKPFTTSAELLAWIDLGLPVQTGIIWDSSCNQEIVDNYRGSGGGGHSTTLWCKTDAGNVYNLNSWGSTWNGDGVHQWTPNAIERMFRIRSNVFIGYAPANMLHPQPPPIEP